MNDALPKDERQRREQLSSIALDREALVLPLIDSLKLCPEMTSFYFLATNLKKQLRRLSNIPRPAPSCNRKPAYPVAERTSCLSNWKRARFENPDDTETIIQTFIDSAVRSWPTRNGTLSFGPK
jgi:hypothetical protein